MTAILTKKKLSANYNNYQFLRILAMKQLHILQLASVSLQMNLI
jgi:hypothetical protein